MRFVSTIGLASLAFTLVACGDEPPAPITPPPPPTMTADWSALPNGLELDLLHGPCGDQAAVVIAYELGSDHDPAGSSGMARVLAALLRAADAESTVEVGREHLVISRSVPASGLSGAIERAAQPLAITEASLVAARTTVLAELGAMRGGEPSATAISFAAESILPSRAGGFRGGIAAEIEAIDVAGVQAFAAGLRPMHARLVVVGAFEVAAVRTAITSSFGVLAEGTAPPRRDPPDSRVLGSLVMGDAPSVIAIAVPAPHLADPLYPAFLMLAARLLEPRTEIRWAAGYDWLGEPETAFVTGALLPNEAPDAAAIRLRADIAPVLGALLSPNDVRSASERFASLLGTHDLDPATCARDPRALAVARARRAQLGADALHLDAALAAVTEDQLREAASRFTAAHSTAVIAGGAIR